MNDGAAATVGSSGKMALGGLSLRLVQDGVIDEAAMTDAVRPPARASRTW